MGYHGGKKKAASITKKMTPIKAQGPLNESEMGAIPFNNATIKRLATQRQVKDVERYNPKTGKSTMIYKPGRG